MLKTNLPVLVIRDVVVFPHSEVRMEFDTLPQKQLLSLSEAYYKNQILVVVPKDELEVDPDVSELPKIGVIAEVKMHMDMPNGKTRVALMGLDRGEVLSYTKEDDLIECVLKVSSKKEISALEEEAYIRSLKNALTQYIDDVSYMSNSLISSLNEIHDLSELTDLISMAMPLDRDRKYAYLIEMDATARAMMLLEDMDKDMQISELERKIESRLSHELDKNQKEFILKEKIKLIKDELGEGYDKDQEIDDLREKINKLGCSDKIRENLLREVSKYEQTPSASPELSMIKSYLDWFLAIPWTKETKDVFDISEVKKSLDASHYALESVKTRILEYLAVKQNTNNLRSPILCLVGPPGVGKTSLAMAIAKSLGRTFTKISVGGVNDEAEIVGHRRTYVGALPGLIIQGMKKAGTVNPVFLIDEIDKMSKSNHGDPASSLLEVLDPEQNNKFMDHYLDEEYDLSKVMFITTANYLDQIPTELQDRLEVVELSSYTEFEKVAIAKTHLISKELKEHGISEEEVTFTDAALLKIVRNYTKEAGVRDLERVIASILRKIVMDRLLNKKTEARVVEEDDIETYLGKVKYLYNDSDMNTGRIGVVNGLAYTSFGGDLLPIEATSFKGKGELILTGKLGEVMKESAMISLSYIKAHAEEFHIDPEVFETSSIHIHVPEGAVPKDGPSAGVTLTTALLSLFTKTKVSPSVAMTGEMTLQGKVLPIGGLKEKSIGAHRGGVRKIFIPRLNEKDLEEIPDEIRKDTKFVLVDQYQDIYKELFKGKRRRVKDEGTIQLLYN